MWRIGLLALLLLLSLRALAVESLTWALLAIPGVISVRDGQVQDGVVIEFLRLLEVPLSDVAPRYQISNLLRAQSDMEHGRNLCVVPYQRSPERDRFGYFVPLLISPPLQVVLRAGDGGRLPLINGRLWLDDLLASDLHGGFLLQRIHPPKLQMHLAQEQQSNRLMGVNVAANYERLLQMLSHKRFDYIFEYPQVVAGFVRDNPQAPLLHSVPLADFTEMPVLGSYCTRNEWGRAMSIRIDNAVRALLAAPQQVQALYRRGLPADSYQIYQPEIQAFLHQRASQSTTFASP